MDETDFAKTKNVPEEYSADSINIDDARYSALREDLEADARDFEAPTWSLAVDQQFLKAFSKEVIKRQDVIHELIQTEINHVRTLKLVLSVYVRELRETFQLDETRLERLFPQVENLLQVHQHFLKRLKQRRVESMEPDGSQNYCIHKFGDILIAQFSGEMRDRMRYYYGVFCSHHTDAVNFYKELMQNNKKFHNFIKRICQLSIMRRLGVPEIILLITQRITKYPVLIERILKNTEVDSEEHRDLERGLELLKETIAHVNAHVDEFEKAARLRDLSSRLEPKSQVKMAHGQVFRREDMLQGGRKLLHEGPLNWRLAPNRSKDVLVLLLSDVLLLLQEKDQRLVFASLDGKSAVISLLKLIVRKAAHNEKAMFLISTSFETPEMYEFHTSSGEECNTWRDQIWKATESCPNEEDEEELSEKIKDYERWLCIQDAVIEQHIAEKHKLFARFAAYMTGVNEFSPAERRLLHEPLQGDQLLAGALKDVEFLQRLLIACELNQTPSANGGMELVPLPKRPDSFSGLDSETYMLPENGDGSLVERLKDRNQWGDLEPQLREFISNEIMELSADEMTLQNWNAPLSVCSPKAQLLSIVTGLSQKLNSLQAVVIQLESKIEVQRATIEELVSRPRANTLLEQEKHRNWEKQREELANFQRLQNQYRQEQAQWEQEREKQKLQAELKEKELKEREQICSMQEAEMMEEKQQLARCREEYQQDLERLRDSMRAVEKEKEKLEQLQKKYKKNLSNTGMFSLENEQTPPPYPVLNVVAPGPEERPPLVPPRRESIYTQPVKTDVPIHLISTTNQSQKVSSVQQQIPTKLAGKTKGKEKHGRNSHQRTSSAAGLEVSQVLPIKVTGKEGGSLKSIKSYSSHHLHPDMFINPGKLSSSPHSHSANTGKKHNHGTHNTHQGHRRPKESSSAEDILFF